MQEAYSESDDAAQRPANAALRDGGGFLGARDWVALIVVVAGGLNTGLIAAVNLDLFARVLPWAMAARTAYGLVGLAALHCVVLLFRLGAEAD